MADSTSVPTSAIPHAPDAMPHVLTDTSVSPAQIDSRRAQQLLERAMALSERGDTPGAVLACRQAITLNPTAAQGYSMLGMLLERAGDTSGAIAAYEKVLQIDPGSMLERESVSRLRTADAQRRSTQDLFFFDDGELFDEREDVLPAVSVDGGAPSVDGGPPPSTPARRRTDVTTDVSDTALPAVAAPVATATTAPSPAVVSTPVTPRPAAPTTTTPATPRVSTPAKRTVVPAAKRSTPVRAPKPAPLPRVAPAFEEEVPATLLQKLMAQPSFYFRGAPLAATTLVSLVFLLWANNYAASRDASVNAPSSTTRAYGTRTDGNEAVPSTSANPATTSTTTNPVPSASTTAGGGVPVNPSGSTGSGTAVAPTVHTEDRIPSASTATTASTSSAPVVTAPTTGAGSTPAIGQTQPTTNTGTGTSTTSAATGSAGTAPQGSSTVAGGGASSGGAPLNPGGSPNRDYVRVAPTGGRAVPRADARAARDERTATSGGSGAIAAASRAIEAGGGDTAVRYQQRAQLYLDSGDNVRAINDFQTAIAAYNDMIARGDRVALARTGIQASQRGMQIARARLGR